MGASTGTTGFDVITMGETMVAFEAQDYGPLSENSVYKKWIGGAEDNFVIGLARLGFRCGWFSRLGHDEFGKEILRTIKGEGVDVSRVKFDSGAPTGVFFVERQSEGEFKCYYYRQFSAASCLSKGDIDPHYIRSARAIYITGITPAISESAREATEEMFRLALENGQMVIFDPNLRLKLWGLGRAREVLIPLMQKSTYVLPGEEELTQLMDCKGLDAAIETAHGLGIGNIVVKTGVNGAAIALAGERVEEVPAYHLQNPISSMGAGDCFGAGFVAGLLKDQSLAECVRWGNAMAAFCLMGWGPYQTLPGYDELQAFLAGKGIINR
jgi:2-dehydro-3-deoxygluconokinase